MAELVYNTQISEATKYSPFELLYGRNPDLPGTMLAPRTDEATSSPLPEAAEALLRQQQDQYLVARNNMLYAKQVQKTTLRRG